jgi:Domain of unknown function (DUF4160)
MVTVYRGNGWKIAVYGRDHGIPHFHIEGPDFRCSVAIENGDMIIGSAPADVLRNARAWASKNRAVLMDAWRELNG